LKYKSSPFGKGNYFFNNIIRVIFLLFDDRLLKIFVKNKPKYSKNELKLEEGENIWLSFGFIPL